MTPFNVISRRPAVADLEIQKGVSDMHVVYGQQNTNMSTHTIFSTRSISSNHYYIFIVNVIVISPSFLLS